MLHWVGSRLRTAQYHLALLRLHDPNGFLPGSEAVVADMLALKADLELRGFMYTPRWCSIRSARENLLRAIADQAAAAAAKEADYS